MGCADLLAFRELEYRLGDEGRAVKVSGALGEGGVLFVRGPSGSGKSTLLRVLARISPRAGGEMLLKGEPADRVVPTVWRRDVQYVAQRPVAFAGSVVDNIMLPYSLGVRRSDAPPGDEDVRKALRSVLLSPNMLSQECGTLSGGELARVALLRGVLARPRVLLLDEPTSALDDEAREGVLSFLLAWLNDQPVRGIVWVSHLKDIERFSDVGTLDLQGRNKEDS